MAMLNNANRTASSARNGREEIDSVWLKWTIKNTNSEWTCNIRQCWRQTPARWANRPVDSEWSKERVALDSTIWWHPMIRHRTCKCWPNLLNNKHGAHSLRTSRNCGCSMWTWTRPSWRNSRTVTNAKCPRQQLRKQLRQNQKRHRQNERLPKQLGQQRPVSVPRRWLQPKQSRLTPPRRKPAPQRRLAKNEILPFLVSESQYRVFGNHFF